MNKKYQGLQMKLIPPLLPEDIYKESIFGSDIPADSETTVCDLSAARRRSR
jgi:hypothetical protein